MEFISHVSYDNLYVLAPLFILAAAVGFVLIVYLRGGKPLPIEEGMRPLASAICAGWIGDLYATFPLVRIRLYDTFLVIRAPLNTIVLQYGEIGEIGSQQYRRVIAKGIAFLHAKPDVPKRVVVFPMGKEEILQVLRTKVAKVEEAT